MIKTSRSIKSLSLVVLAFSLVSAFSSVANSQTKSIYTNKKNQITFQPPKGDRPQQTVGGASRGEQCPLDAMNQNSTLIPLLPTTSRSLTVKSHPTLLVHVPQTSATTAFLAVRDAEENYDYQTIVSIGDRSGIISVDLPNDAPALEIENEYKWSLILMCDGKLRPDSPVVQGDVTRVAADRNLEEQLAKADLLESANLYAEAGLWYDMLSSMAKLKSAAPKDIAIALNWQSLLTEAGLENVVKAEIVE